MKTNQNFIKTCAKVVVAGVAIALFISAVCSFSDAVETSSMEALWNATTADTKVIFIGLLLAGMLAS